MSSSIPGRVPRRQRPVRWRPRARPLAAGVAAAFVGLCGFLGVRMATGQDPALGGGGRALQPDASAKVVPRGEDDELSQSIGVLVDVGRALFGEDEESSRGAPANPSTGTSD